MSDISRARPIFHSAHELDADERSQYVDAACKGDDQLRRMVNSLLVAHEEADQFMEKAAVKTPDGVTQQQDESGRCVDQYKLLQKIGEGGFGVVYMAEQQKPIVRRVALKVIKPGMDTKQVIARFEAERQALALMEHPSIAQVYDAGETENGRPYFVMELVRGIPVIEFCDQRKLTNQRRLELFRNICEAIQHAHQKGIIHRDLKPSNILVTMQYGEPVPKVIDFGIAKATQQRLTEKTLFTRFEQFVRTPVYMSPEQAQMSSLDVDTRSDIYSLGVLLYELLTGTTPLDVKQAFELGLEELCRRIREEEFEPPSKRVSSLQMKERTSLASNRGLDTSHFPNRLQGELDWIVMKAVDKDRRRRYETASSFGADIERYLKQEPVTAVPLSATYQLRKWIHRHRAVAFTVTAILASLLVGTTLATIGMLRAMDESSKTKVAQVELAKEVVEKGEALATAQAATQRAVLAERETSRMGYFADMNAAHHALRLDNIALAKRILERHRDYEPDNEPRNWEWRALWLQCQDAAEITLGGSPWLKGCGAEGKWVAFGKDGVIKIKDTASGEVIRDFRAEDRGDTFAPDGNLVFARDGNSIEAWGGPGFDTLKHRMSATAPVDSYGVSPDSKWLVALCNDGQVNVFDCSTGELVRRHLVGNGGRVVVARDTLAIWKHLKHRHTTTIRVMDLATLEMLTNIDIHNPNGRFLLVISPNGEFIVGKRGLQSQATVYRTSDGEVIGELRGHSNEITAFAVSPDSKLIATGSHDHTVRLWEPETFTHVAKLIGHEGSVFGLAFTANSQHLVSSGRDEIIRVWRISDVMERRFPVQRAAACEWWRSVSLSPDAKMLAATRSDHDVVGIDIRSTENLNVVESLVESGARKTGVRYSPVDDLLAVGAADGSMEFIDFDNDRNSTHVLVESGKEIFPTQFTPDGERLVVYVGRGTNAPTPRDPDRKCAVYSVHERRPIASWAVPRSCDFAAISPNGELVATGDEDGVRFWTLNDLDRPVHVASAAVVSVDFSPNGKYLVAGGGGNSGGLIAIIDVDGRRQIDELVGHKGTVAGISFSPDGKRIASAGSGTNDAVRIWDFRSRREVMLLTVADARFNRQIDWSTDGNSLLMMGGNSAIVTIWRVPSMDQIRKREQKVHAPQM